MLKAVRFVNNALRDRYEERYGGRRTGHNVTQDQPEVTTN